MTIKASSPRTRIKICGLRNIDDAIVAVEAGADAIGLVFHKPSPRYIAPLEAIQLRASLPAFVSVTALFLNEDRSWIAEIIDLLKPDILQFHGSESPLECEHWGRPYIKAIPMGSVADATAYAARFERAQGFLMDSNVAGRQGGSGDTFDWTMIPSSFPHPLILAGGLTPDNVAAAVKQVHPYAVDVSSGVESARGIKDSGLIRQFCNEVKRVDCEF